MTLDHFQDFVDEMTATPWPGEREAPSARAELSSVGDVLLLYRGSTGQEYRIGTLRAERFAD